MVDNRRIAKNTLLLYFRLLLMVAIQLYTVPILLKALGTEDYGLYNVIGSVMALVSLVGFITSGSQRFFSYAIGENNKRKLESLFISTRSICIIIAAIVFVFLEIAGLWFLNNKMHIPMGRHSAAVWVFQLSTITFCIGLLSIPYKALIVAYERMNYFAYVSIFLSFLKLMAAILINYIFADTLIMYAIIIFFIQILERVADQYYCYINFSESRSMKLYVDRKLGYELLTYSSLNVIGGVALSLRKQGMNVLINLFFGTIINAAHSIANQISTVTSNMIGGLYQASRPQITKSCANGDLDGMWKLVYRTSLLAYYLVMSISVFIIFELPSILVIWLHVVPSFTVEIARVMLICLMLETITNQLISVLQAMNRIKECQLFSSVIMLMNLPLAYLILKIDDTSIMYPYYVQIFISIFYVMSIIIVCKKVAQLRIHDFLYEIMLREVIITIFVVICAFLIKVCMPPTFIRVMVTFIGVSLASLFLVLTIGFNKSDKEKIMGIMKAKMSFIK